MKDTKRALRRHHRTRLIRRVLRDFYFHPEADKADRRERAARLYNNRQMCSCWMCGNARKVYNLPPVRDQRLEEAARYEAENILAVARAVE